MVLKVRRWYQDGSTVLDHPQWRGPLLLLEISARRKDLWDALPGGKGVQMGLQLLAGGEVVEFEALEFSGVEADEEIQEYLRDVIYEEEVEFDLPRDYGEIADIDDIRRPGWYTSPFESVGSLEDFLALLYSHYLVGNGTQYPGLAGVWEYTPITQIGTPIPGGGVFSGLEGGLSEEDEVADALLLSVWVNIGKIVQEFKTPNFGLRLRVSALATPEYSILGRREFIECTYPIEVQQAWAYSRMVRAEMHETEEFLPAGVGFRIAVDYYRIANGVSYEDAEAALRDSGTCTTQVEMWEDKSPGPGAFALKAKAKIFFPNDPASWEQWWETQNTEHMYGSVYTPEKAAFEQIIELGSVSGKVAEEYLEYDERGAPSYSEDLIPYVSEGDLLYGMEAAGTFDYIGDFTVETGMSDESLTENYLEWYNDKAPSAKQRLKQLKDAKGARREARNLVRQFNPIVKWERLT